MADPARSWLGQRLLGWDSLAGFTCPAACATKTYFYLNAGRVMPSTYNGIGTWYYGRRNAKSYHGECEFCSQEAMLQDYETRLWFVIFFVPIIPLGRKQILAECHHCKRHRATSLAEWEAQKEQSLREAMALWQRQPNNPESAIELLSTMSTFGSAQEANQTAAMLETRFADNADLLLMIGAWYKSRGQLDSAIRCTTRAHEIAPDSPSAQYSAAAQLLSAGQLDQAAQLLATSPHLSVADAPELHAMLGQLLEHSGRDQEAYRELSQAVTSSPELANNAALRKSVQELEHRLGQRSSVLPRRQKSRQPLIWAAVAVLACAGIFGLSLYAKERRTLHVFNGLPVAATIRIDQQPPQRVSSGKLLKLVVAEGPHTIVTEFNGHRLPEEEFTLEGGPLERLFGRRVNLINVAGAAVIEWEEQIYATNPNLAEDPAPSRFYVGNTFLSFDDIDYVFQRFPEELRVDTKRSQIKKHRLSRYSIAPHELLGSDEDTLPLADQFAYTESHLLAMPTNQPLLNNYVGHSLANDRVAEALQLFERELGKRPANLAWHLAFQNISLRQDKQAIDRLTERYDALVAAEPENLDLLYLRTRLEHDPAERLHRAQAITAFDPNHGLALALQAECHREVGDFAAAAAISPKVYELLRQDDPYWHEWQSDLVATGQRQASLEHCRQKTKERPLDLQFHFQLVQLLVAEGLADEAAAECARISRACVAAQQSDPHPLPRLLLLHAQEELPALLDLARAEIDDSSYWPDYFLILGLCELGQPDDALETYEVLDSLDSTLALAMGLGYLLRDNQDHTRQWRNTACEQLAHTHNATSEELQFPADQAPTIEATRNGAFGLLPHDQRSALLVLIAAQYPGAAREPLLAEAEKFNYSLGTLQRTIARAIAHLRQNPLPPKPIADPMAPPTNDPLAEPMLQPVP